MRKLILLTAIPGAGKSTWANDYKKSHPNTFIVSSDELRKEFGGSYQYFEEEERVWKEFLDRTNKYASELEDCTVILDSTCLTNKFRKYYALNTSNFDKKVLIYLNCSLEKAIKRNYQRAQERFVPENVMESLYKTLEVPSNEVIKLFDSYLEIEI